MKRIPLVALCILICSAAARPPSKYRAPKLFELVCEAELVVAGTIVALESPSRGERRSFELHVERHVAGEPVGERLSVRCFGDWTCGARWAPYEVGQRVLLFLVRDDDAWWILGGGDEGEMPILGERVLARGFRVRGYDYAEHGLGGWPARASLLGLDELARAVAGFRATHVWERRPEGLPLATIRPRVDAGALHDYAASSRVARHLCEEARSSWAWLAPPPRGESEYKSALRRPATAAAPPGPLASSCALVGDLDGDGTSELAVGTRLRRLRTGMASVWLLSARGGWLLPLRRLEGGSISAGIESAGVAFGEALACIGDLDGDGFAELAFTAGGGRAVELCSLGPGGATRWRRRLEGVAPDSATRFHALAALGDLDGDGVPDLAAGDPHGDDGGEQRGAIFIALLRPDGSLKARAKLSDWEGGFDGLLHDRARFGRSLHGPGDLDGDGTPDLLAGSAEGTFTLYLRPDGRTRAHARALPPGWEENRPWWR